MIAGREARLAVLRERLSYWKEQLGQARRERNDKWATACQSSVDYFRQALCDEQRADAF